MTVQFRFYCSNGIAFEDELAWHTYLEANPDVLGIECYTGSATLTDVIPSAWAIRSPTGEVSTISIGENGSLLTGTTEGEPSVSGIAPIVIPTPGSKQHYHENKNTDYKIAASFPLAGSDILTPTSIQAHIWIDLDNTGDACKIRIVNSFDGTVLAELSGIETEDDGSITDLGTISNWPTDPFICEIQHAVSSGSKTKSRLSAVIFNY